MLTSTTGGFSVPVDKVAQDPPDRTPRPATINSSTKGETPMIKTKAEKIATLAGTAFGLLLVGVAVLALKAWLLGLVLGWFGITALGFWKAVVALLLLDLILTAAKRAN